MIVRRLINTNCYFPYRLQYAQHALVRAACGFDKFVLLSRSYFTSSVKCRKEAFSSKWIKFKQKNSIPISENVWTVPNFLCVLRMGISPAIGYLVVNAQYLPALGLFVFAGVTDLLDGWIARVVPGQATVLGSFLDPMADKVLVGVLFVTLTYSGLIPLPLTGLIVSRDAVLIGAASYIRYQSLDSPRTVARYFNVLQPSAQLAPTFISKINTGVQLSLVACTLVSAAAIIPYDLQSKLCYLWYITAATTITSALSYIFAKNTYKFLRSGQPLMKTKAPNRSTFREKKDKS